MLCLLPAEDVILACTHWVLMSRGRGRERGKERERERESKQEGEEREGTEREVYMEGVISQYCTTSFILPTHLVAELCSFVEPLS